MYDKGAGTKDTDLRRTTMAGKDKISQDEAQKYKDFYDQAHSRHTTAKLRAKARITATKELRANNYPEYKQLYDEAYKQLVKGSEKSQA
jgi:hypothetical protein